MHLVLLFGGLLLGCYGLPFLILWQGFGMAPAPALLLGGLIGSLALVLLNCLETPRSLLQRRRPSSRTRLRKPPTAGKGTPAERPAATPGDS